MDPALSAAVAALRAGEEAGAFDALVRILRAGAGVTVEDWVALLSDDDADVRRAAVSAAVGRAEPKVVAALAKIPDDLDDDVREALAETIGGAPDWPMDEVLAALALDPTPTVWAAALTAVKARRNPTPTLVAALRGHSDWNARLACAEALEGADPAAALPALVTALAQDDDRDVSRACAKTAEKLLEKAGAWPDGAEAVPTSLLDAMRERTEVFGAQRFAKLVAWVAGRLREEVDVEALRRFGTDLTAEAEAGRLPRAYGVDTAVEEIVRVIHGTRPGPRAAVVLGPPGCGKTAVVSEVVHRLRTEPRGAWRVLRVSSSDLLAGTLYLGEWETKVRDLMAAIRAPRRVLLYVPNLAELAQAGKATKSDLNVATMIAPIVESGAIAILGESTPEAFRHGLGEVPSLRRLFAPIEMGSASPEETRRTLKAVRAEARVDMSDADVERLMEVAEMYLPGTVEPGRAVGLLRRVIERHEGKPTPIRQRQVLEVLATSTGIPVDFLDDDVPLDLAHVRRFFEERVMGQPEAVAAVLDLVALVKAGLTDPKKPFGILLFIGPTGVGKTEMARALAECLFGDPARLLRFDMSEYATADSHQRLIGHGPVAGLLTSAVREHPFSVILLDEIEKAHVNAWDLCLQIFDAGRLTDERGATTDFRRTIVVLTSNLGAAVPTEAPLGFGSVPEVAAPDREAVVREVLRFFRPEFVNRIDHVVTFRQLGLETAEQIARREISAVLERGGITRRRLTVDVDPSVLALLLKHGYSPAFGARPLKRTVERFVLLPVARAVARGGAPAGSVLRLVARGDEVLVDMVPAEGGEPAAAPGGTQGRAPPPAPAGEVAKRAADLLARAEDLARRSEPVATERSDLLARSREPGFWDDKPAARRALDRVHRLDRVATAVTAAVRAAKDLVEDAKARPKGRAQRQRQEERATEAARLLSVADALASARDPKDLADAYVLLTQVKADGDGLDPVGRLASMYAAFARRNGFEVEALDDRLTAGPAENELTLLVGGAGAYALLASETGMHQFALREGHGGRSASRPAARSGRWWVRVEVLPAPADDAASLLPDVTVRTRSLRSAKGRLLVDPNLEVAIVHKPTGMPLRAWTTGPKDAALSRLLPILLARIEADRSGLRRGPGCLRRYVLGPNPKASDRRTGSDTPHLDRVLRGELELLRAPSS